MEWVIIWIIWLACGFIAGAVNNSGGHSFWSGLALGLILGPIGVIIALITGSNEPEMRTRARSGEADQVARGEMKRCPFCAELIRPEATVCPWCWQRPGRPDDRARGADGTTTPEIHNADIPGWPPCPSCGRVNKMGRDFCWSCGANLG